VPTRINTSVSPTPRSRYVSINDAVAYLSVTERTIRQMIAAGRLIGYRNGAKFIRLDLNEIDERMVAFGGGVL
jgi:excisionase family DNA binding protein